MPEYLVPGVFVEELSLLPPAVAEVESAVPAFVGYTAQARRDKAGDLRGVPQRIRSLAEFETLYGKGGGLRGEAGRCRQQRSVPVGQHRNELLPVRRPASVLR